MKAPSNPMAATAPPDQGNRQKFQQRLDALYSLKGRHPYWLKPEDAAKLSRTHDLMPHPDLDPTDLLS